MGVPDSEDLPAIDVSLDLVAVHLQFHFVFPVELPGESIAGQDRLVMITLDEPDAAVLDLVEHQRVVALPTLNPRRETPRVRK